MQANDTTPRKGAMYLRKSKADIEKEKIGKYETLVRHEAELMELAERRQLPIDDTYKELVSGESIEARPEFKKLMAGVKKRKYSYVMCHAVDRLGRGDMMEYGWVLRWFKVTGTLIITPGKVYDPTDPYDMRALQMQMFIANIEYEIIKERFKSGREASVRDGQYIAQRSPFGYDKVIVNRKKTLAANDNAKHLVSIFEKAAAGEHKYSICNYLNKKGVRTTMGNLFSPSTITRIVGNPVYKGYVRWNNTEVMVEGGEEEEMKKVVRKSDHPMIVKGIHEPLVSEELWQAANDAFTPDPRKRFGTTLKNPLAGVLVCSKCGRSMRLNTKNCKSAHNYFAHGLLYECNCKSTRDYVLLEALVSLLSMKADEYEMRWKSGDDGVSDHEEKMAILASSIESLEKRKSKLVELYTEEAIFLDEFRDRRAPIEAEIERLEKELEEESQFTPKPAIAVCEKLRKVIEMIADDSIPAEARNTAIKAVIDRIEYTNEGDGLTLEVFIRD